MFESTKWILEESDCVYVSENDVATPMIVRPPDGMKKTSEIGIIQQYQFSSSLQRMSVIVRALGSDDYKSYTKGSPEMIIGLSKPETVPKDIALAVERYTTQGYRVIAMGCRPTISESNTKVTKYFPFSYFFSTKKHKLNITTDITITARNGRMGLGVFGIGGHGEPIEETDDAGDHGIEGSERARCDDHRFD